MALNKQIQSISSVLLSRCHQITLAPKHQLFVLSAIVPLRVFCASTEFREVVEVCEVCAYIGHVPVLDVRPDREPSRKSGGSCSAHC